MIGAILGALGPVKDIAGKIADTIQGKRELIAALAALESGLLSKAYEYEQDRLKAQQQVIVSEAQSQSWITRSWRPLTMLAFVVSILGYWFGLVQGPHLTEEVISSMFSLVQIGLGGYVVGRSAEQIAKTVAPAISEMKLRRKKD